MEKKDDITMLQLEKSILKEIKSCKKILKVNNKFVIKVPLACSNWRNGAKEWTMTEIKVGENKYRFNATEITDTKFCEIVEKVLNTSGCIGRVDKYEWEEEIGNWPGSYYLKRNTFKSLELFANPCKEFIKLQKALEKYSGKKLGTYEVYSVNICGKRNNVRESGLRRYLCFEPKECLSTIEYIKKNRTSKDVVSVTLNEEDDSEDREYANYYETEWYGTRRIKMDISVTTPKGKEKAHTNVYIL